MSDSRGAPLSGAAVNATGGNNSYNTTTGNDGTFKLNLPPGIYSITVNHGGFQTSQNDEVAITNVPSTVSITMQELNLSSLRVIGRTGTTINRTPFNVSESSVPVLPPLEITLRQNNNLTDTVATMPGVIASRTFSATPNTSFVVRGGAIQTRVTVDGHAVSSGISGQWNTNYAVSGIFQDVEVVKGTGLNGALAGESAVGTVNVRTRDFTRNNMAGLQIGTDSWNGGIYNAYASVNFLKDNRASLVVAKSFIGFNGPWNNYMGDRVGRNSAIPIGTGNVPAFIGFDQWQGDFSNRYSLQGELAKLRYRFSETSSLTLEYLGLQGQYQPQGGAYGTYVGQMTLQACQNGAAFQASLATCTASSNYPAPYTFANIGNTVPGYQWFPNSFIQNNEPGFAAEFRTSWKNDTILFRPYTHLINRFISGVNENKYPGNGGIWNAVTNVANCQVKYLAPGPPAAPRLAPPARASHRRSPVPTARRTSALTLPGACSRRRQTPRSVQRWLLSRASRRLPRSRTTARLGSAHPSASPSSTVSTATRSAGSIRSAPTSTTSATTIARTSRSRPAPTRRRLKRAVRS